MNFLAGHNITDSLQNTANIRHINLLSMFYNINLWTDDTAKVNKKMTQRPV
jgi:hypothetical protein